jgi:hypothetical protein
MAGYTAAIFYCIFLAFLLIIEASDTKRTAVASLILTDRGLLANPSHRLKYKYVRELFLHSLRATGYDGEILFLIADQGFDINGEKQYFSNIT